MDVEMVSAEDVAPVAPAHPPSRGQFTVVIDESHPFDLEAYISNYSGRTAVDRLIHIVVTSPSIANEAVKLALQFIYQSRDPAIVQNLLSAYDQVKPPAVQIPAIDTRWVDETVTKNQAERTKLETELKTYTNNMIKESIRMAHRDLGSFYRATGDYPTALKHYTKSREFCTTSQHVLDMCLSVLELLIEQRNYSHIPTYVFKAEAALDAATAATNTGNGENAGATGSKKSSPDRERVQTKLDFATALSHLGQGNYDKAAYYFTRLGSTRDLGDWVGKLVSPGDIAIYGTVCALASLSRSAFKAQVLGNSTFGVYVEQEPYIRDLIQSHMDSSFKTVLDILNRHSTRHYLDIHLAPHVHDLSNSIRNKAVVLYFQPFSSIKLDRMSSAFGWTVDDVERHVVSLIQSGDIHGRVDSQNKILYAKKTDYRADLFARATKAGIDMQAANRKLLLRMRLQQADLLVKAPKGSHQASVDFMPD